MPILQSGAGARAPAGTAGGASARRAAAASAAAPGTRRWEPGPARARERSSRAAALAFLRQLLRGLSCASCSVSPTPLGPVFAAPRPVSRSQSLPKLPSNRQLRRPIESLMPISSSAHPHALVSGPVPSPERRKEEVASSRRTSSGSEPVGGWVWEAAPTYTYRSWGPESTVLMHWIAIAEMPWEQPPPLLIMCWGGGGQRGQLLQQAVPSSRRPGPRWVALHQLLQSSSQWTPS